MLRKCLHVHFHSARQRLKRQRCVTGKRFGHFRRNALKILSNGGHDTLNFIVIQRAVAIVNLGNGVAYFIEIHGFLLKSFAKSRFQIVAAFNVEDRRDDFGRDLRND